jgi:hypothetical protein
MKQVHSCRIDADTGNTVAAGITNITDKRGYGARWRFSPRHVDNLIAAGLPHLKIGSRRVRIVTSGCWKNTASNDAASSMDRRDEREEAMTREIPPFLRALPACPAAGTGVHSWIMSAAHRCRRSGMVEAEAVHFIEARITRPRSPPNEVETAVAKAYRTPTFSSTPWQYQNASRPAVPLSEIKFDEAKLRAAAAKIKTPASWRHWLWERSPKRPEAMNALSCLAELYHPSEVVLIFDRMDAKEPAKAVSICRPMDCRLSFQIRAGESYGRGIWFLCNPVDGQWHSNPRQNGELSCRSEESVSSFRYAVLESDQAEADSWLAFIVQLPLRVSAIYTSGGRSIHVLIRIDAKSKEEWDRVIGPLKRPLKLLGADPGCLSAVRLTRLPQCWRPEKGGFQRLLYLCPNPPLAPLIDFPVLSSRLDTLARWHRVCPRWNRESTGFA